MRPLLSLLALLILLAAGGAGVVPGILSLAALLACAACLLPPWHGHTRVHPPVAFAAAAILAAAAISVVPIPASLDALLGRRRATQNETARQMLTDARRLDLTTISPQAFSLTRNRAGTLRILLLAVTGFAAATLAARIPPSLHMRALGLLTAFGLALGVAGFLGQWIFPQGKTLWWHFPVLHGRPVGCFMNRNHFGGFVALFAPAAMLLAADAARRRRATPFLLWAAAAGALVFIGLASLSRGAWMALAASLAAVFLFLLRKRRGVAGAVFVALLLGVLWGTSRLPGDQFDERVESLQAPRQSLTAQMRLSTWKDALPMTLDYPVLGTGLNAFRMVFPQYRTASTRPTFKHAENEYLQVWIEVGLLGLALLAALGVFALRAWRRQSPVLSPTVSGIVFSAVLVASIHALFDFALVVPLYFCTLCALLGLVVRDPAPPLTKPRRPVLPALAMGFVLLLSLPGMRIYERDASESIEMAAPDELAQALAWAPTSWQAWYHLGRAAIQLPQGRGLRLGEYAIRQATEYDPRNYRLWKELCLLRLSLGDTQGAQDAYDELKRLRTWIHVEGLR